MYFRYLRKPARGLLLLPSLFLLSLVLSVAGHAQTTSTSTSTQTAPGSSAGNGGSAPIGSEKSVPTRIVKFDQTPVIDGVMNEAVWKQAAVLRNFYQTNPGDNTAPSYPTEVYLGYDAKTLYIGFHAYDDPTKVRATIAKRDDVLNAEDSVRILLDTFNDRRRAYVLAFNPFGVQQDGIRSEGSGVDFSVDIVMESKGTLTDDGYTVEVAIPFKSLRYEAGKGKLWGVQVFRIIQRLNSEQDSWMPLSRNNSSVLGQAGHITGLEGIATEHTLELIPSLTFSEEGKRVNAIPAGQSIPIFGSDPGRFVNQPMKADFGLTAKYGITPTVTLDFTYNPDFAQVEADQLVVTTNQRFPIFYPEKRPFFLEGVEIFRSPLTPVHTRAIVAPEVAAKLTGKEGKNSFGLLFALDNGPGNFVGDDRLNPRNFHYLDQKATIGVLRLKHDVGSDSNIGLIATTYNFKPAKGDLTGFDRTVANPCNADKSLYRTNQLGGIDGHFRIDKATVYNFQILGSTSQRCFFDAVPGTNVFRKGNGFGYSSVYDVTKRNFGYTWESSGQTRDYRSDVGFISRTNTNFNGFAFRYSTDPKQNAKLVQWQVTSFTEFSYDFQKRLQVWQSDVVVYWFLQRNTNFWLGYRRGHERLFEEEFGPVRTATRPGTFAGQGERGADKQHFVAYFYTQPVKAFGVETKVAYRMGTFDFDFGGGPKFPRVSPGALVDPNAPLDPGAGNLLDISADGFYKPTNALRFDLEFLKNRLTRYDTGLVAFDDDIFSVKGTYQFTRFLFARARLDYTSLEARARGQFLLAWTPNPGTAFYVGYNDDVTRNGYSTVSGLYEPGFRRNGRTFFIKMSYLFRKSF